MPRVSIPTRDIVGAWNMAQVVERWLIPGTLSWRVGQIVAALKPHAEPVQKQLDALLDLYCEHEGEGDKKKRTLRPVMVDVYLPDPTTENGQRKVEQVAGSEVVFTDKAEWERRRDALLDEAVEVDIPKLLSEAHCLELAKDRVKEHPKGADGSLLPSPSFSLLACVIEGTAKLVPAVPSAT